MQARHWIPAVYWHGCNNDALHPAAQLNGHAPGLIDRLTESNHVINMKECVSLV